MRQGSLGLHLPAAPTTQCASTRHRLQTMPESEDDKAEHCIKFILERLKLHGEDLGGADSQPPFVLGMNGIQGMFAR